MTSNLSVRTYCGAALLFFSSIITVPSAFALKPDQVVFAFDFHDVIVKNRPSRMISSAWNLFWRAKNKKQLTGLILNPRFWSDVRKIKKEVDVSDHMLHKVAQKYPALKPHLHQCVELTTLHKPIAESVALLKELKGRGYKLYLASNIGPDSFEIMRKKHPEIFSYFEDCYIATGTNGKKPDRGYYVGLKEFLNARGHINKRVIFIDDKIKNIDGALKARVGIDAIRFKSTKGLRKDLNRRGLGIRPH